MAVKVPLAALNEVALHESDIVTQYDDTPVLLKAA